MASSDTVLAESIGPVRVLTLNRPESLNAANLELQERLVERLAEVSAHTEARVLVLTGAGRAFSSGGDRAIMAELASGDKSRLETFVRVQFDTIEAMLRLPVPAIAAVHGAAIGYAAGLAALCDVVVMSEGAFLQDPHVKFGTAATLALQLVWPHQTSSLHARWLLMTGERVAAPEAVRLGLANRLCPEGRDLETALEMAQVLAALPPAGVAATKRAFNRALLDEIAILRKDAEARLPVKVVDASRDVAGRFAAKLMAMSGAEVLRLTTGEGWAGDEALVLYLDAHKTELAWDDGVVADSIAEADVVFTSFDQGRDLHPAPAILPLIAPRCVQVTTSTFGRTGPYAGYRGGPAASWSAGGYLAITGDPDREPLMGPEYLCEYVAGYVAAVAVEAALAGRRRDGRGRRIDISTMEAMLTVHQSTFSRLASGEIRRRTGRYTEVYPLVFRPCASGYVSIGVVTDAEFDRISIAFERPDLPADPRFVDAASRMANRDALDAEMAPFLLAHDAEEVVLRLVENGIPTASLADPIQILSNPQLIARGFWAAPHGRPEARMPGDPLPKAQVFAGAPTEALPASAPGWLVRSGKRHLPLAGVRVLDLTAFWAGPSANRTLADLGADVIWLERPGSRDDFDPASDDPAAVMGLVYHWKMHRHKRSAVLDLGTAAGRAAARALALEADVLIENLRPGVAGKLGLGHAELCAANPGLVYVSLTGWGSDGPWGDRRSYGPNIEIASSIAARTGYAGGPPLRLGHTLPDGVGGLAGALAALRGLRERQERGHGGWYDVAQLEAYVALSGEDILAASIEGGWAGRIGNRSRHGAIQGMFRCRGEDQWVVIRLEGQDDLDRLAAATGLDGDADTIEARIATYAASRDKAAVARTLQAAGLEALPVLTPPELVADPHLRARGFFTEVRIGARAFAMPGHPYPADPPLADCRGAAPTFGEHTASILDDLGRRSR